MTGQVFGNLTVLKDTGKRNHNRRVIWLCKCSCPKQSVIEVSGNNLQTGNTTGCGCRRAGKIIHGHARRNGNEHPLYHIWESMKDRCCNPNNLQYKDYGGRGIKVCNEWYNNPGLFIEFGIDSGWQKGLQIDRKDNDGNYCPENCRFVTRSQNMFNRRNTIKVIINNKERSLFEVCREYSIPYILVKGRLQRGWSIEKALTEPKRINQYQ